MATIEQSIEVAAPLSTVYNQWTQFEEFPRFMEGVEQITQHDDTTRVMVQRGGETGAWRGEVKRPAEGS